MMTTKMMEEIKRRNLAGENDREIARAIGSYPTEICNARKMMNLGAIGRHLLTYCVYDNVTGDLIVRGTASECAAALGISTGSFRCYANRSKTGRAKKRKIIKAED